MWCSPCFGSFAEKYALHNRKPDAGYFFSWTRYAQLFINIFFSIFELNTDNMTQKTTKYKIKHTIEKNIEEFSSAKKRAGSNCLYKVVVGSFRIANVSIALFYVNYYLFIASCLSLCVRMFFYWWATRA